MHILQICSKPPYPPLDGGAIGMNNVSRGLIDCGNTLKILSVCTPKHQVHYDKIPIEYLEKTNAEFVFIDTSVKALKALLNLFSNRSYNIERFYSPVFEQKITEVLQCNSFDIVLIESIYLSPYIPCIRRNSKAKLILRAPNIEHIIWQRLADEARNPIRKKYLQILTRRIKKAEQIIPNQTDGVYTVTRTDMEIFKYLGCKVPLEYIPTGIDTTKKACSDVALVPKSVFHIGAMDWMPNIEGLEWFLNEVWERIHSAVPEAVLFLAGRSMPEWFKKYASPSVCIVGEVADADIFMAGKEVMVVPLFSGSGMRVKIVEGMMMKKAVVTTSIGIEGIVHQPGKDVLIANTAEEFALSVIKCLKDNDFYNCLSSAAKINADLHYDNKVLAEKNHRFFLSILNEDNQVLGDTLKFANIAEK